MKAPLPENAQSNARDTDFHIAVQPQDLLSENLLDLTARSGSFSSRC